MIHGFVVCKRFNSKVYKYPEETTLSKKRVPSTLYTSLVVDYLRPVLTFYFFHVIKRNYSRSRRKQFGSIGTLLYLAPTLAPLVYWKWKTNLFAAVKEYGIDVIWIKEHPTYHEDQEEIRYHLTGHNWILATSSAATYNIGAAVGRVGMLLCPKIFSSFSIIEVHFMLPQEPSSSC